MARDIGRRTPDVETGIPHPSVTTEHDRNALLVGHAALNVWTDFPRDAQERVFAAAADSQIVANLLAFLCMVVIRRPPTRHAYEYG
jgi:hypothetical protein